MRLHSGSDMHLLYVSLCSYQPKHGIFIRINNVQDETFKILLGGNIKGLALCIRYAPEDLYILFFHGTAIN